MIARLFSNPMIRNMYWDKFWNLLFSVHEWYCHAQEASAACHAHERRMNFIPINSARHNAFTVIVFTRSCVTGRPTIRVDDEISSVNVTVRKWDTFKCLPQSELSENYQRNCKQVACYSASNANRTAKHRYFRLIDVYWKYDTLFGLYLHTETLKGLYSSSISI